MSTRRSILSQKGALIAASLIAALLAGAVVAVGYPLDGAQRIGIRRLAGYLQAQQAAKGAKLPAGALLGSADIQLNLTEQGSDWDIEGAPKDPVLQVAIEAIFAKRDPSYGVAVIDISDPEAIAWAGVREDRTQLPGSVGKLLCLIAVFDGLKRIYPDPAARERVLRERVMVATDWTLGDAHTVPKYDPVSGSNRFSVVAPGDRFTLSEWIDHMISASANSAGAMVWKEAMLMRRFGAEYPPSPEAEAAFLRDTPKAELTRLSQVVIEEPLIAAGIDTKELRQGTMWTRVSQARIPGLASFASPGQLVRVLLRIEQGRMVDAWSSLEMKRFLYMTKRRYRYVYAPELAAAAVYFKSGSFYECQPEPDFKCARYMGNVRNLMNSVAIVETPAQHSQEQRSPEQKRYLVVMFSNVLKVNSAWDHSRVGAAIDEVVRTRKPAAVKDQATPDQLREAGKSETSG